MVEPCSARYQTGGRWSAETTLASDILHNILFAVPGHLVDIRLVLLGQFLDVFLQAVALVFADLFRFLR